MSTKNRTFVRESDSATIHIKDDDKPGKTRCGDDISPSARTGSAANVAVKGAGVTHDCPLCFEE